MFRSIGEFRARSPIVIPAILTLLLACVVAVIASSGAQASIPVPQGTAPQKCVQPFNGDFAFYSLDPASGPPGSQFNANLSNLSPHIQGDWPVVVLWDWGGKPDEDIIAEGTSPMGQTTASVLATVPIGAAPGDHRVSVCWQEFGDNWYWLTLNFNVTEPTPTPTASPTPTPTPTPTPSPTPSPTPAPTLKPFKLFPFLPLLLDFPIFLLPTEDLSIHGIEITQGIQCFDTSKGLASCPNNSLPVVAKKNTTARIYLKYSGAVARQSRRAGPPAHLREWCRVPGGHLG